eukprot:TRINITY_DN3076_c0_g2_i1.p1 TRINITY_DN3076_c0_g2~~TRINITY_DN3076_c0_g2_i1.p1  ORF type:complete len:776 (+),score=119.16 TRINITY_DN3076_c0_g2_i1:542-2869(+)
MGGSLSEDSDGEEFGFRFTEDDLPQRTSSAPPVLEVQENSLFALGNNYAPFFASGLGGLGGSGTVGIRHGVNDIRMDEDYLSFYQSYGDRMKLPPPISASFGLEEFEFDTPQREQYSPSNSPRHMRRSFLPHNYDGNGVNSSSPRSWSRPLPRRLTSVSSLEDYAPLGVSAEDLLPVLSSDSESVSSSVEDISALVQNFNLNSGNSRTPWTEDDTPQQGNKSSIPPGLGSLTSVEQSLGDAEVHISDMPPQRRKEPQRGQTNNAISAPVTCRYYVQGYCSRGDRCNFVHADGDSGSAGGSNSSSQQSSPQPPASAPKPIAKRGQNRAGANSSLHPSVMNGASQAHRRKASAPSVITSTPSAPSTNSSNGSSQNSAAAAANNAFNALNADALSSRFTTIDQVIGQIYPMCKDQHGCRFLQKKLDEKSNVQVVDAIFNEVYQHFSELMTDPFGNYLCQKLLEHCNDKQRLLLIESVAGDLVRISQNMHGTRAVQKMIECLRNQQEIRLVTRGLRLSVVQLIKDLNGNHVVQRCLNHLSAGDNQFIYDAVAGHCVEVATHRHGCCVLQRCIDHASESQKVQLVNEITSNGLTLVKDPYGNYVVQYVLDLPYPHLISNLAVQFVGHLAELSTQKFSSNVVEKCLTSSDPQTRAWMIKELTETEHLKSLIQDPFGNYVIQTAMSVADIAQHQRMVEGIKPHLYALRNTPYGKRIQNRILKDTQIHQRQLAAASASQQGSGVAAGHSSSNHSHHSNNNHHTNVRSNSNSHHGNHHSHNHQF